MKPFGLSVLCLAAATIGMAAEKDYSDGVFIVNEDWYGHQNSTINFLRPYDKDGNYWEYRVFQEANPDSELGCTNQYGAIHDGRFFFIAKQDRDPGASVTGGRITVADVKTMKMLFQSSLIDPSGQQCDGRSFVGLDSKKGYISTSHGVWVFDLQAYKVTKCIEGTENPNGHSATGNTDSSGPLYHGQCGTMVITGGKLFVAHQAYGMLVIDTQTDTYRETFTIGDKTEPGAGIGSIVLSKDGNLWLSVTKDIQGMGETLPYIIRVNPKTLEYKTFRLPEGIYSPAVSWYAWTPDGFCASAQNNCLYWNGGFNNWFSNSQVFKYDIDNDKFSMIIDLSKEATSVPWKLYGCSMRVHPDSDELYMSLYHEFGSPVYITRRADADGNTLQDYDMIENYWFPSLPVFPCADKSGIDEVHEAIVPGIVLEENDITAVNADGLTLEIYNIQGTLLRSMPVKGMRCTLSINLPSGLYVARLGANVLKFRI